jgi:L-aminopeptidase/D-esterase-like protein
MSMITNDLTKLTLSTSADKRYLELDFPGLCIGSAAYEEGPTGCTVFCFPDKPVLTAIDVRGGSVASTGGIGGLERNDAIVFAGGSTYGMEAATGVDAEIFAKRNYSTNFVTADIALVSGAVIYDFLLRENSVYPDKNLGREALNIAKPGVFPIGECGAGCSATVG